MGGPVQQKIGVTNGLRGYYAVLYDQDGPIQTGIGSYETPEEAACEACDWAASEDVPVEHSAFLQALNLGWQGDVRTQ
jgi:hypothetical protein